ncbi:hypothetical protein Tco_0106419, partial [Tanacetum coccineum]
VEEGDGSEQPTKPNQHLLLLNLGAGGNTRDQVQLSNDSPHSCGNTSERAEGGLNLEELLSLCTSCFGSMVKECEKVIYEEKVGTEGVLVSKQGRKNVKPGPFLDAFDDLDVDLAHGMDYMDT